ncbi:MAG: nuclear transport factor 2 family protein [Ferrovibrio sp.]|uniref:nuclear transport factor 2 family protein n=1 Tax=Ferrovibrio sp. TaxID=1917215 RepID=UPI00262AEF5F|nr:nuclear transport factor 2 family protein [Ferrovibrio sp.]MCW0233160.1 nuclear transport factor 2 family protein [Ferrovibrio sp.]
MNNPQVSDILAVVQTYLDGLYEGDTAKIRLAFHPASSLFAAIDNKLVNVPREDWCRMIESRPSPKANGQSREYDRILSVDITGPNTAMVKVNCAITPRFFTDYLSLIKLDGRWQVINKTYTAEPLPA